MLNLLQELQNFPCINLEDIAANTSEIPDNIKNSVILYNKARESIHSGSEDIAVIELKKAVSMNPAFFEALNLLGLCYTYMKEYAKAEEVFRKVVSGESNGLRAAQYLQNMYTADEGTAAKQPRRQVLKRAAENPADAPKKTAEAFQKHAETAQSPAETEAKQAGYVKKAGAAPIILRKTDLLEKKGLIMLSTGLLIGIIASLAVSWIGGAGRRNTPPPDSSGDAANKALMERIAAGQSEYARLEASYKSVQKDLETANANINYYKSVVRLGEAENLALKKDYVAAADILVLLRTAGFRNGDKEKFDSLNAEIMPAAAKTTFEQGLGLHNSAKYQEALGKFDRVQVYTDDFERMDATLYYTGKCYMALNDSRNALATFQKILEKYPQSRYRQYSQWRINELTQLP